MTSKNSDRRPSKRMIAIILTAVFGLLLAAVVVLFAPPLWTIALIATVGGFVPGALLFPWLTSPFGPGLWMLSEPFARIHLTISQFIRRAGVLVKRADNNYEIGTYLPDSGEALLSDGRIPIDEERTSWGLFGKRKFGVTWELGTDLYERVTATESADAATDGGDEVALNMAAAHRYFRGTNDADVISRTEENAEAEYGGGGNGLSEMAMALLVGLMLVLGSMTTFFML